VHARKGKLMRTEADLMAAFGALEERAPDSVPVWRAIQAATGPGRSRRRRPVKRWVLGGIATAAACAGTALALTLTLTSGTASQHRTTALGRSTRQVHTQPVLHTARQVLLLAAAHVPTTQTSGNYWHLKAVWGTVEPAGTKAHPYNVVWGAPTTVWYAREPGKRDWELTDTSWYHHATPLTAADRAAWLASGSPSGWYRNPAYHGAFFDRVGPVAQGYSWQVSNGVVGYTESDLNGLSAAKFAKLPASVAGLRRYLFAIAGSFAIAKDGGIAADDLVWSEALNLLVDPVSGQVRASAYRVMAALPGVKLLGLVRDPFGREGYGLRMSGFRLYASPGDLGAIINPATGTLLDTSYHAYSTRTDYGDTVCHGRGGPANLSAPAIDQWTRRRHLSGPAMNRWIKQHCTFVIRYYGRPYSGLLDNYKAFFATGWVNALPHVPHATQANGGSVFFSAG
jgi:hypothetical protein